MLTTISRPIAAQATMTAEHALMVARRRFPNLCANGILGRRCTGPEIDLWHISKAVTVLAQCRKTKVPTCHSFDLRRQIGGVSVGPVICAAGALDFQVCSWSGVTDYMPHCLIGVDPRDVDPHIAPRLSLLLPVS
jgi:hypothetical protein